MLQIRFSINGNFLKPIELLENYYTIGRSGDLKIPSTGLSKDEWQTISRIHCTLIAVYPTYLVVDGNNQGKHSDNGIIVNGRKCRAAMLRVGDLVNMSNKVYFELLSDKPIEFGNPDDTKNRENNLP